MAALLRNPWFFKAYLLLLPSLTSLTALYFLYKYYQLDPQSDAVIRQKTYRKFILWLIIAILFWVALYVVVGYFSVNYESFIASSV